jgi:hypothetical protein
MLQSPPNRRALRFPWAFTAPRTLLSSARSGRFTPRVPNEALPWISRLGASVTPRCAMRASEAFASSSSRATSAIATFRQRSCDWASNVDAWPAPPTGLFVVEERTVYLRSRSRMTAAHEFAHALDCALGNGTYRSGCDPELRRLFSEATRFVTPYQGIRT